MVGREGRNRERKTIHGARELVILFWRNHKPGQCCCGDALGSVLFVFVSLNQREVICVLCVPRVSPLGCDSVAPVGVPFSFVLVDDNNRRSACRTDEAMPTRFVTATLSRSNQIVDYCRDMRATQKTKAEAHSHSRHGHLQRLRQRRQRFMPNKALCAAAYGSCLPVHHPIEKRLNQMTENSCQSFWLWSESAKDACVHKFGCR